MPRQAPAASPAPDAETLAFAALGWLLADGARAERLLAVTGLDADGLRAGIGEGATQAAVLAFLEAHEPDLIACAAALDVSPDRLVAARGELERA